MSVLLVGIAARPASADDKSAAEAEFVKAKRLMNEQQFAEACAAFERSDRLDPQNGTKYNLALCYVDLGRTASAFVIFRELAASDQNRTRKADSKKRAAALEPKLIKLLVTTRAATPGLVVTRDGADVTRLVGIEEPIDPGRYRIAASADGYRSWEQEVEVTAGEGAVITVEIPALERPGEPGPDQRVIEEPPRRDAGGAPRGRGRRILGIATAGVGAVSVGVGLVFGLAAAATWDEVKVLCGDDLDCDTQADYDEARAKVEDARGAGTLSNILVGVGLVAVAGGVYLWLTAPHGVQVAPQVDGDAVGLVAAGSF